jgi:hypothetical protein
MPEVHSPIRPGESRAPHGSSRRITAFGRIAVFAACVAIAGCQPSAPPAPAAPRPAPAAEPKATPPFANAPARFVLPSMDLPPGPIYACDIAGVRSAIELGANVERLCRRHPEMGPCKFERDACRRRGGRVYTANGDEITAAVEAEYDKKVMGARFQGDAKAKP